MPGADRAAEISGVQLAPELTCYLPYLMRRAYVHVAGTVDRSPQARELAVLDSLADQQVSSQQELAERLEINRTTMVTLIDGLEAAGHVIRTRNPDNRRSYLLSLTPSGRKALTAMRRSVVPRDDLVTANLDRDEQQRLGDLLRAVLGAPESPPTNASIAYLIAQVFNLLRRRGDDLVSDLGLRIRNFASLSTINKLGPCPQQDVARYLAVTEPAAAQIVDELVQAGLVARGQAPTDRRRYALELTDLGRQQLVKLRTAMNHLQADVRKAVGGTKNEAELHRLLHKLLPPVAQTHQPDETPSRPSARPPGRTPRASASPA